MDMPRQLKIEDLPDDILLLILNYLDKNSKLKIMETSKKFYELVAQSSVLLDDIVPELNLCKLSTDSSAFQTLSNSRRKFRKCIFTNHMIDKPLIKFVENEMVFSLRVVEFRDLRLNLDAFILVLDALLNLEEIHFQNVQILGTSEGKFVRSKNTLNELVLDKLIHEDLKFLHSWKNIKVLKIQFFNPIFNEIIFCQEKLQHLEIIGYKDEWKKLSKFQLTYLKVFFVEPSDDFLEFLEDQMELESLELRSKFEFNKNQLKKFLSCILRKKSLLYLTLSLQEVPELADMSFFYEFKSNLKNLAINTYGNNSVNFIANFLCSASSMEYLHLISEPESQTDQIGFSINQLEKLEYLNIDRCSGDFLKKLVVKKADRLKIETFIGNCEDCEEFLNNNRHIREFRFLTSFPEDQILKTISHMENLEILEILLENPVEGVTKLLGKLKNLKSLTIYKDDEAADPIFNEETRDFIRSQKFEVFQENGTTYLKKSRNIL